MSIQLNKECLELVELLQEGRMLSHPLIKRHVDYALTTGDYSNLFRFVESYPAYKRQAQNNIAMEEVQKRDNPYRPFPSRDVVLEYLSGPLKFGWVNEFDDLFGLNWNDLCLPTIIPGRVGGGKSQLMKYLITQIFSADQNFNVILPDLKLEYRNMLPFTTGLRVLTNKRIMINPLQVPEWLTPREHIMFLSKVFIRENWLGQISEHIVVETLEQIYSKNGIFDGNKLNYPTMEDMYNVISGRLKNERSYGYRDVLQKLKDRLNSYILCGNFSCRHGIPNDVWRDENVVLEMDTGFSDYMYSFVISYIAGLRYTYNKKMGLIGSKLRTLFNVDEGRILFSAHRDISTYGESYIAEIITKIREFGVGFIVASPETASFNQTLKAISFTKICFPLTDGTEKTVIQESFGLDDEQADYLFRLPRFGQAIVRYGGYEKPFLLAVPHLEIKKQLTDEEVEKRMSTFYRNLEARVEKVETIRIREESVSAKELKPAETIPPASMAILYFLSKEPFTNTKELENAPGFTSGEDVKKAVYWLEKAGYVERKSHKVKKFGNYPIFSILTEKAYAQFDLKRRKGKGSFEHGLYQNLIQKNRKSLGIEVSIEGKIKGSNKLIDVLAKDKERGWVAYEVTIHHENLTQNIHKDLEAGASEIVIVTKDQSGADKAVEIVSKDSTLDPYLEKITFVQISDFSP